jgi:hypothetical protein
MVISEWWIGNVVEGSHRGLILGTITEFAEGAEEKQEKP